MNDSSEALRASARVQSRTFDRDTARTAVELVLPLIEAAMREPRYGDSGFLHIVVMDPERTPDNVGSFEDAILYEHSVGDRAKWDADYAWYARGKTERSWRDRADNPKGAACVDGIVVGCSGAFEPFDCAYAAAVAHSARALVRLAQERA
jgi:hypothetical protein